MKLQESEEGDPVKQNEKTTGRSGDRIEGPKEEPNDEVHCTNTVGSGSN